MADKWEWRVELTKAHVTQADVGIHLGLSSSQMAHLVKKMVEGKGLIASATDKKRWDRALGYIDDKQKEASK